jgi:hypothetical protein
MAALVTTLLEDYWLLQDLENEVNLFQIKQFYIIIISSQKIFSGRCVTYHGIILTKRIEHWFKSFLQRLKIDSFYHALE